MDEVVHFELLVLGDGFIGHGVKPEVNIYSKYIDRCTPFGIRNRVFQGPMPSTSMIHSRECRLQSYQNSLIAMRQQGSTSLQSD